MRRGSPAGAAAPDVTVAGVCPTALHCWRHARQRCCRITRQGMGQATPGCGSPTSQHRRRRAQRCCWCQRRVRAAQPQASHRPRPRLIHWLPVRGRDGDSTGNASTASPHRIGWRHVGCHSAACIARASAIARATASGCGQRVWQGPSFLETWAPYLDALPRVDATPRSLRATSQAELR